MLIGIHALDDLIEALQEIAEVLSLCPIPQMLQNRLVVFVDEDDGASRFLLAEFFDQVGEENRRRRAADGDIVRTSNIKEPLRKAFLEPGERFDIHAGKVQVDQRMRLPSVIGRCDGKTLE